VVINIFNNPALKGLK